MARTKVKKRAVWQRDVVNDPMYPFKDVPFTSVADTATVEPPKTRKRVSWGGLKARYATRKKGEEDDR